MKKKSNSRKVIAGLILALVGISALLVIISILEESDANNENEVSNNENEDSNVENDENTSDDGEQRRRLYYVGNDEMYEILNDTSGEGFFVYIGRPTCPNCVEFEPTLEETLRYLDQELRYYQVDLAFEGPESEMTVSEIMDELEVTGVPRIVYIENGEVIDGLSGNREKEDVISFFEENGGLN